MTRYLISREIAGKSATAFEHLRQLALEGELPLGRRLAPQDLASYFGVSASPVRDALMRLSTEGLIEWKMSQGFFSKPFDVAEQRELHEALLVLVSGALDRLAPAPPADLLIRLTDIEASTSLTAALLEDHLKALTAAAGNRVMAAMTWSLIDRTHLPRKLDLQATAGASLAEGLQLMASRLLRGDAPKARQVVARLIDDRISRLPTLVDQANAKGLRAKLF